MPVGGSFTGVTVTVTVAVAVPPLPSEIVYVNVVVPLKLGAGVKLTWPPCSVTVPLGRLRHRRHRERLARVRRDGVVGQHVQRRVARAVLGHRAAVVVGASGGSFTGVTVTVTVAVAVPPLPSETVYVNVVVPWKSARGREAHRWWP